MKTIPLTQGKAALVDNEDYDLLKEFKWFIDGRGYAVTTMKKEGKNVFGVKMHRVVLKAKEGELVDHKDGNKLNNKKENLRTCSFFENVVHREKTKNPCSSLYKGVYWNPLKLKWVACIKAGKKRFSRIFSEEKNAALWYDEKAMEMHGDFAKTNFDVSVAPIISPLEKLNTSIHRGVCWDKNRKKWLAYIKKNGKHITIGRYDTEQKAALAYLQKRFESNEDKKTVLFSGKFSIVHSGHISTIMNLAAEFGKVKVVILDYEGRETTVDAALKVFYSIFKYSFLDVKFYVSKIHFGKITLDQLRDYEPFDIYASGNMKVLNWIESLGIITHYVPRSFFYKSSNIEVEES